MWKCNKKNTKNDPCAAAILAPCCRNKRFRFSLKSLWCLIQNMQLIMAHVFHMCLCTECMKNSSCETNRTDSLQMETESQSRLQSHLIRFRCVSSDSMRSHPGDSRQATSAQQITPQPFPKKRWAGMREMHRRWGDETGSLVVRRRRREPTALSGYSFLVNLSW